MSEKARFVIGQVVGDSMDKTVSVKVARQIRHPLYGKYVRRSTKLLVHDEDNQARVGDRVRICECRPRSRHKAWELVEILAAAVEGRS